MSYLFTTESVSEGHPDKIADQISDALLDEFLSQDPDSKVACETLVTTGLVILSGEVRTNGYVDLHTVVRKVLKNIGYTKPEYHFDYNSCGIISTIHEQSPDIFQGVKRSNPEDMGAGDQGMMFGYACRDMFNYMPIPIELAHHLVQELSKIRKEGVYMTYLRPDAKSQVTIEYDDNHNPIRIDTIVVSTQHDPFDHDEEKMCKQIRDDIQKILIPRILPQIPENVRLLFKSDYKLLVNPTGKFIIGGPHGDTGLTGRKIIVDTYGGCAPHGGGAFSGKDASKVDRSGAYAMRHLAKNIVAAGLADEVLTQISYAIGVAQPINLYVNTFGTGKIKNSDNSIMSDSQIAKILFQNLDFRPYSIIKRFGLQNPIFQPTAAYGHFGRDPYEAEVEVAYKNEHTYEKLVNGQTKHFKKVTFFAWEKLDLVDDLRYLFKS